MANPRNTVKFDGIGRVAQTYNIDGTSITFDRDQPNGSAQAGLAVKMTGPRTVGLTTDGSDVVGLLEKVESDNKASVQTGGYMPLPGGEGAALTLGNKIVGDLGPENAPGYIRAVATGTAAELGRARGMIVDGSVPAQTWVRME